MTKESRGWSAPLATEIGFNLGAHGCGDVSFRFGSENYVVSGISYTTDALGDLVRMALLIASGGYVGECSFDGEPNEFRVVAKRRHGDAKTLDVTIYELENIAQRAPLSAAIQRFTVECLADDLAAAIESVATKIQNLPGRAYQAEFNWEFPFRALAALRAALALAPPSFRWGPPPGLPPWE